MPEVVKEAQHDGLGVGLVGAEQIGGEAGGDLPEQRRAEQDAGQDLADDLGLVQLGEELPEEVGPHHQQQHSQQDVAQLVVVHRRPPASQ